MTAYKILGLGALATVVMLEGASEARPKVKRVAHVAAPTAYFLSANPHVPLAVVENGSVLPAVTDQDKRKQRCGSKDRWAKVGSRWNALDTWGQIIGTVAVAKRDDYDVTGCSELSFAPDPESAKPASSKRARTASEIKSVADDKTHLLVSADSAWQPRPSVRWTPAAEQRAAFMKLLDEHAPAPEVAIPNRIVPEQCKAIREHVLFFDAPGRGRYAVGGTNAGYLIAHLGTGGWEIVEAQQASVLIGTATECYRPVAVFDMNGDAVPEIVLRRSSGDGWSEVVLELNPKGDTVLKVAQSPGGGTA